MPILAIVNRKSSEKTRFNYYFMDINAKVTHRFSSGVSSSVSFYFGDDGLHTGTKDKFTIPAGIYFDDKYNFHWGNLVVRAATDWRVSDHVSGSFTAAYTRFFSRLSSEELTTEYLTSGKMESHVKSRTENHIDDWIFRADFKWHPVSNSTVRFGAGYTRHSFLPARTARESSFDNLQVSSMDSTWSYRADEANLYIENDWRVSDKF